MKQKNYLIYGLKRSGIASFNLLYNKKDKFYLYDEDINLVQKIYEDVISYNNVFVLKQLNKNIISFIDEIIISPSISIYNPMLQYAKTKGISVISELELGFRFCKNKIVAITGTNGKTTTTSLTAQIFRLAGFKAEEVGNIGVPLCERVNKVSRNTIFICEVSSFQLEAVQKFKPKFAGILNITPDHLNRHKTFLNYKHTKFKIFKNLKNTKVVINQNIFYKNKNLKIFRFGYKKTKNGCYIKNNNIVYAVNGKEENICTVYETNLIGKHNLENIMASICFAKFFHIKNKYIVSALKSFHATSHRIEKIYERAGMSFYDDSKATNIDSCIKATLAFKTPTILILGGSDKGYEYDDIFKNLPKEIILVAAYGQVKEKVKNAGGRCGYEVCTFETLKQATEYCCSVMKTGQNLLLSPASASFDQFSSYKERGEKFLTYIKDYYEA